MSNKPDIIEVLIYNSLEMFSKGNGYKIKDVDGATKLCRELAKGIRSGAITTLDEFSDYVTVALGERQ